MEELACIADDDDFASLKRLVDTDDGWSLEVCKANTLVWTRSVPGCNFQMVKINVKFEDIDPECVFDVLLDPDYRKVVCFLLDENYEIFVLCATRFWILFCVIAFRNGIRICWKVLILAILMWTTTLATMQVSWFFFYVCFFSRSWSIKKLSQIWLLTKKFCLCIVFCLCGCVCDSVVSATAKAQRFCTVAFMAGYGSTRRANASITFHHSQRLSTKKRICTVCVLHFHFLFSLSVFSVTASNIHSHTHNSTYFIRNL